MTDWRGPVARTRVRRHAPYPSDTPSQLDARALLGRHRLGSARARPPRTALPAFAERLTLRHHRRSAPADAQLAIRDMGVALGMEFLRNRVDLRRVRSEQENLYMDDIAARNRLLNETLPVR